MDGFGKAKEMNSTGMMGRLQVGTSLWMMVSELYSENLLYCYHCFRIGVSNRLTAQSTDSALRQVPQVSRLQVQDPTGSSRLGTVCPEGPSARSAVIPRFHRYSMSKIAGSHLGVMRNSERSGGDRQHAHDFPDETQRSPVAK